MPEQLTAFIPFTKFDEEQRLVYGVATSEDLDSQGDILDWEGTKLALADYAQWGNVREMHEPSAVGKAVQININEATKQIEMISKVVDDAAWGKVKESVYKGYSIGGTARETATEMAKVGDAEKEVRRILKWDWMETSLVDRPSNPAAMFTLFKRDMGAADSSVDVPATSRAEAEAQPPATPMTKQDEEAAEVADALTAQALCDAIKKLIVSEAGEDGTDSYDLQLLTDALRLMEWFAQDELYEQLTMAAKAYDLKKGKTPEPIDTSTAIAGLTKVVEGLAKTVEELAKHDPLAKFDLGTLAKAEDVKSLGARLEKVEGALVPGGPILNSEATAVDKQIGSDPLAKLSDEGRERITKLDDRILKTNDPHELEKLGQERALLMSRGIFAR
jgi:hypothetical protein